ncbi:hypothetical protein D3C76_562480 [compost metagenome]
MLAGVGLDGGGGAAVGVAFTQYRVHGAAEYLAVACADFFFLLGLRIFREVRDVVAQGLQFGDGAFELRYGGADVRQFDDVRFWRCGQNSQLGEVVFDLLVGAKLIGEGGKDAPGKRNVSGFDVYTGGGCEGFYYGEKRVGGEGGRFIGEGVGDLRADGH